VKDTSFEDFYRRFYNRQRYELSQPILEAYPERSRERVFLVPELCALTGLTEEMRKDRMLMQEVLQHSMVGVGDRLHQCVGVAAACSAPAPFALASWGLSLSTVPAEFHARQLEPVEVSFGLKRYTVEDGNFQRHTRHGSHCPVHLQRWLAIYPESDKTLVDMWLRSMREIGGSGFGMHFAEPTRIVCSGAREELRSLLLERITADIQLVMLFRLGADIHPPKRFAELTRLSSRSAVLVFHKW
jgi:aubergine-like protein